MGQQGKLAAWVGLQEWGAAGSAAGAGGSRRQGANHAAATPSAMQRRRRAPAAPTDAAPRCVCARSPQMFLLEPSIAELLDAVVLDSMVHPAQYSLALFGAWPVPTPHQQLLPLQRPRLKLASCRGTRNTSWA